MKELGLFRLSSLCFLFVSDRYAHLLIAGSFFAVHFFFGLADERRDVQLVPFLTADTEGHALGFNDNNPLTVFFDNLLNCGLLFSEWHCGHYHTTTEVYNKYHIHYRDIERIL